MLAQAIMNWGYGLNLDQDVLTVVADRQDATYRGFRQQVEAGDPAHLRLWEQAGPGVLADIEFTRELFARW